MNETVQAVAHYRRVIARTMRSASVTHGRGSTTGRPWRSASAMSHRPKSHFARASVRRSASDRPAMPLPARQHVAEQDSLVGLDHENERHLTGGDPPAQQRACGKRGDDVVALDNRRTGVVDLRCGGDLDGGGHRHPGADQPIPQPLGREVPHARHVPEQVEIVVPARPGSTASRGAARVAVPRLTCPCPRRRRSAARATTARADHLRARAPRRASLIFIILTRPRCRRTAGAGRRHRVRAD